MNQENNYTPEDMSSLVRHLAEAGWLEGKQFVDNENVQLHYSEKGRKQMRAMIELLRPHTGGLLGGESRVAAFDSEFFLKSWASVPELIGKIHTPEEGNALLLVISFYRKHVA